MLTQTQIEDFRRDGYLIAEKAVTADELAALRADIAGWVEESRGHDAPFGEPTIDGRPRHDLGPDHSAEHPALRRINNPSDVSAAFAAVMENAGMVDMVADLVGPDVKFHHCKVNLKLPGTNTEVLYHQDFAYTPHSNDDIVTALLMLDDMTEENGCLMVVPGSHKGPVHSLFQEGRFTGFIEAATVAELKRDEVAITGKAGSVCLMHTRLAHGSAANLSGTPRGLYICVYTAADAVPLAVNPMPNPNEGKVVRGQPARSARLMEGLVELPQQPKRASFFAVQEEAAG